MNKNEETLKYELNYLALQISEVISLYGYSPSSAYGAKMYIKNHNGKLISIKTAYRKIKDNVNYIDDEIINEINSNYCIQAKLKKDCNNK